MTEESEVQEERNYEAEASKDGWVPQDEWHGDASKWTDAETFVKNGEKIAGIAVKKARRLEEQVETLQTQFDELQHTKKQFAEFHQRALEKERAEKAALIDKLEQKQVEAINEGDGETYLRLKKQIEQEQAQPEPQPGEQPWAKEWASENRWYASDKKLRRIANVIADEMREEGFPDGGKDFLDEVARRTKETMPDKFENPNRKNGIASGDGKETDETATPSGRSYDALPADAKAACDRFVAEGLMTKAQYVEDYVWE